MPEMSAATCRRRLLLALLACMGALVTLSAPASATPMTSLATQAALPAAPWDCKSAPTASLPDTGLPGFFDPAPDPIPSQGDPWARPRSTTLYDQYGYAGLGWTTYDTGCVGGLGEMDATVDTFIGNALMGGGVWISSATNGIHNRVSQPQQYMKPLDNVIATVTNRLHDSIWSPWGMVSLLGVAVLLLVYSLQGRLSALMSGAVWALFVLVVLSGVSQYPTRVAGFFDQAVTSSVASVNQSAADLTGSNTGDATRAQGALIVDDIIYQSWLRGEFGDPGSPAAKKWGPLLFRESTFSRAELAAARSVPDGVQKKTEQKANDWVATTQEIQDQDPLAYAAVQGKAKGRAGAGFMAFVGVTFTAVFRLVADIFVFAGLVMLRLLVMFFPAAAVFGVIAPMASIVRRIGNIAGASVVNVIAFGVGSAIHSVAIAAIIQQANGVGMGVLSLILCLVVSVAAFVLLMPLLSLTSMLGQTSHRSLLRKVGRTTAGYFVGRKAVEDGEEDAAKKIVGGKHAGTTSHEEGQGLPNDAGPSRYVRRVNLPPESIGRRFDSVTWTQPDVPDHERHVAGRVSELQRGLPSSTPADTERAAAAHSYPGRGAHPSSGGVPETVEVRPSAAHHTTGTMPDRGIEGQLVDEVPTGLKVLTPIARTHDSHAEVTGQGLRVRMFDADTKSMVTVKPGEFERGARGV
ncbi:hypothetical protein GCM10009721_28130 [Terrabacter tumescens]|uniref:TrbL/VirB6 plasmid conjugal transfer protein n=2 Tax=Terrabacter tumescens TaxID=60443 RepID=A0ABQ2I3H8_9MICO|nr:hypothetical protein GCM10009721_28130 [Terrabacter tumescens]